MCVLCVVCVLQVLCVLTTTSCFAPRAPDRVVAVSALCRSAGVTHIVNNAYGLQSARVCRQIAHAAASPLCRLDAVLQSTDKNLLVPVGGAILVAFDPLFIERVAKTYPGTSRPFASSPFSALSF